MRCKIKAGISTPKKNNSLFSLFFDDNRDELWKLKTTTETVFELISPTDVRQLRLHRPNNLHTLFDQAVCQLCLVVQTPSPLYFDHALNCVRVLTRLLPFMLENPGDSWVKEVCWSAGTTDALASASSGASSSGGGSSTGSGGSGGGIPSELLGEPLGQLAVHAVMHLLFMPGFTVDPVRWREEKSSGQC